MVKNDIQTNRKINDARTPHKTTIKKIMVILGNIPTAWKFFTFVVVGFLILWGIAPSLAIGAITKAVLLLKKMYVSLILVFVFMYLFNIFVTDKVIKKHLHGKVGIQKYLIVSVIGILSSGPIYMWFAYLSSMKKQGMNDGLISIFLYTRAIKIPLLPLMVQYFSLKVTIVITILIFISSFINAAFVNLLNNQQSHEKSNSVHN